MIGLLSSTVRHNHNTKNKIKNLIEASKQEGQSMNPHEMWDNIRTLNRLRLEYLILIYVFLNDDNEFSSTEQKILKKRLAEDKDLLSNDVRTEIQSWLDQDVTIQFVIQYMKKSKMTEEFLSEAIIKLKQDLSCNDEYIALLNTLRNK